MKIPFDTLITDREPLILIERSKIEVSGSHVVSRDKEGSFNVPISSIHCLLLGNGISITAEAASLCAKHNCYIAFVKGGLNAHSIWHAGRYPDPKPLVKQVRNHYDPVKRLRIAKNLMSLRVNYIGNPFNLNLSIEEIENSYSVEQLLGKEGSFARKNYAQLAAKYGRTFKREQDSKNGLNSSITVANNALYNFIATILISKGLSPSIGFLHGQSRRGGLVFDIADVFKHPLYFEEVFSGEYDGNTAKLMRFISNKLS
ncbi:MAG TPA: CRISPR-associated endonuclease Cas1, partial [Rhabdochlamydiaceae bacterium]